MKSMITSPTTMPMGNDWGIYLARPKARPCLELQWENRLAAIDAASKGSNSNKFDVERSFDVRVGESNELISITGTSRTMGSKGGRSKT